MKKLSTCIIIICFLTSCLNQIDTKLTGGEGEEEDMYLTMTVNVPGVKTPTSYATGLRDDQDHKIDHLNILAFAKNENNDDVFRYHIFVDGDDLKSTGQGNEMSFTLKLLRLENEVQLMVLANCNPFIDEDILIDGTDKDDIINSLTFPGNTWKTIDPDNFGGFPMWGETNKYISTQSGQSVGEVTVDLLRAIARVDVGVDIDGDPALGFGKLFEIKEVYIYNVNKEGFIIPAKGNLDQNKVLAPTLPGTTSYDNPFLYTYDISEINMNAMLRHIYIPEALAMSSATATDGVFLVINARYREKENNYFRLDFTNNSGFIPLLRNHQYMFNITNINGEGYPELEMAAQSKSSSLTYEITVSDDLNEYIYDKYVLGVSSGTVYMTYEEGAETQISVNTDYSYGWTATTDTDWLSLSYNGTTSPNKIQGPGNNTCTFTVIAKRNTEQALYRTGTITITAANLTKEIKVVQRLGANSYITAPGSKVSIPVAHVNADGRSRFKTGSTVKIIWQDTSGLPNITTGTISSIDNDIEFTAPNEGNYLIGLFDTSNEIIWSWHIWVVNHDPENETNLRYNNGFTFMDRNLGAQSNTNTEDSYGLYYQWGRKDPFIQSMATNNQFRIEELPENTKNNLTESLLNPSTFYTTFFSPFDWMGTSQNNNLWNTIEGEKSIYDPCPVGWRIPVVKDDHTNSPWYEFSTNTKNGSTYPLAGGLDMSTGSLSEAGKKGYVWGASARNSQAYIFSYTTTTATQTSAFRGNAYPVRCVKDND